VLNKAKNVQPSIQSHYRVMFVRLLNRKCNVYSHRHYSMHNVVLVNKPQLWWLLQKYLS